MREVIKLSAFILLSIGTVSLLINEFAFDWGRVATLVFAIMNLTGLAILAVTYSRMKNKEKQKED